MKKKPLLLYGITEFSNELGGSWTPSKLWVYYERGKLPDPYAYVGKRPAWIKEQINEYKYQLNNEIADETD